MNSVWRWEREFVAKIQSEQQQVARSRANATISSFKMCTISERERELNRKKALKSFPQLITARL